MKPEPKFKLDQRVKFEDMDCVVRAVTIENRWCDYPFKFQNFETTEIYYTIENWCGEVYKVLEFDLQRGFSGSFISFDEKRRYQLKTEIEKKADTAIKNLKDQINSKLGMIFWFFVPVYIFMIFSLLRYFNPIGQ